MSGGMVYTAAGPDAALWGERTKPRTRRHTEWGSGAEETGKALASQVEGKLSKFGVPKLQKIVLGQERSIAPRC